MADIYNLIAKILLIVGGVMLALAVYIFLKLKIYTVIGNLTGYTAKKSIAKMQGSLIEDKKDKTNYKSKKENQKRKLKKIKNEDSTEILNENDMITGEQTELLVNGDSDTEILKQEN